MSLWSCSCATAVSRDIVDGTGVMLVMMDLETILAGTWTEYRIHHHQQQGKEVEEYDDNDGHEDEQLHSPPLEQPHLALPADPLPICEAVLNIHRLQRPARSRGCWPGLAWLHRQYCESPVVVVAVDGEHHHASAMRL